MAGRSGASATKLGGGGNSDEGVPTAARSAARPDEENGAGVPSIYKRRGGGVLGRGVGRVRGEDGVAGDGIQERNSCCLAGGGRRCGARLSASEGERGRERATGAEAVRSRERGHGPIRLAGPWGGERDRTGLGWRWRWAGSAQLGRRERSFFYKDFPDSRKINKTK